MDMETYAKTTAAFAAFILQSIPENLTVDVMEDWMNDPEGTKNLLSGLNPDVIFRIVATTALEAVVGKPTEKCFTDLPWKYREKDIDHKLPVNQPRADACVITTLALSNGWSLAEATSNISSIGASSNVKRLGNALIARKYTMTLVQAERMVEETIRGGTGMCTDFHGNFFFTETGDKNEPVLAELLMGGYDRWEPSWNAYAPRRLGDNVRLNSYVRLLVPNFVRKRRT